MSAGANLHTRTRITSMHFRPEIGESLTLQFAEAARLRKEAGKPIYSLGLGEPDFETPPAIIEAVSEVLRSGNSRYSSPLGLPSLRTRIAEKLREENGVPAKAAQLLVAAGAKQALSIVLMAMLQPEDEVIVVSPAFVSFIPQIYLAEPTAKVHVVEVSKEDHSLPIAAIEAVMSSKTRAILINSPNNPAGFMFGVAELKQLLELAERNDAYVISDEVYEKLVFGEKKHISIGAMEPEVARVITINSFSKSHALTGWRIGYATFPQTLGGKINKIQMHLNTNTCTFIQDALVRSWDTECPHLPPYMDVLKSRVALMETWLAGAPGITGNLPAAGFFAFLDIRSLGVSSNTFCADLLEKTGVATTPGIAFGEAWDDHFRLSYAVDTDTLTASLDRISEYLSEGAA